MTATLDQRRGPWILLSYAYFDQTSFDLVQGLAQRMDVLIDSGAFTAHRQGHHIDIGHYTDFCLRLEPVVYGCVQLDVPGDRERTRSNLVEQRRRGAHVMPVLTVDMDISEAAAMMEINRKICLAGGLSLPRAALAQRALGVQEASGGVARIHALAYVRHPEILMLPLASVDSSSYTAGGRYGLLQIYQRMGAVSGFPYRDHKHKAFADLPPRVQEFLRGCNMTEQMWRDREAYSGAHSFLSIASAYAWMQYARDAWQAGRRVFLAIASTTWLWTILALARTGKNHGQGFDVNETRREMVMLAQLWKTDREALWARVEQNIGPSGFARGLRIRQEEDH